MVCSTCDPRITLLSSRRLTNPGWTSAEFDNPNNQSIVIRVDFDESSFLFTGDLEEDAIGSLLRGYEGTSMLDVDVHQVGHHGSENGTTPELLEMMSPERAVVSCGPPIGGCGGQTAMGFGHPRWSTIDDLEDVIAGRRSPKIFPQVANAPCSFVTRKVSKRVYATPWDGNIRIRAKLDGSMATWRNQ